MVKEITVHKAMIAFRMLFRQANVFIHVKGDDVLEANLACFMHFNQRLVGGQRGTTGWQTRDERTVRGWFKCINAVNDMAGSPFYRPAQRLLWESVSFFTSIVKVDSGGLAPAL